MQLRTALFMLLIIWQFASFNALQNQSAVINKKQDLSVLGGTENIEEKAFYRYEPESFMKNQSARMVLQPRVLTEKIDIEIDANKSMEKLKQQLINISYKPVVLLVDETNAAFKEAVLFGETFFKMPGVRAEFRLMVFNASGVSGAVADTRSNSEVIISQLRQGEKNTAINNKQSEGSAVFFAVLKASQILPRNSAIILFTDRNAIDEDLAQLSVNSLIGQFIKLNVMWCGTHPSKGREEKLLEEAVLLTNGLFLLSSAKKETTNSFSKEFMGTKEIIVFKKHLQDQQVIPIPIDRSLRNVDIIIEGKISSAVLSTPTGMSVDLLDGTSVRRLTASAEVDASTAHDRNRWTYVRFNTANIITTTPVIGIWYLRINGLQNDKNGYNVTVYADTELCLQSEIVANTTRGASKTKEIYLKLNGAISKIETISFIDTSGREIKQLPSNIIQNLKSKDYILNDSETILKNQIKLSENIKENPFYVEVSGTNNNGEKFSRLSYVNERNINNRRMPMIMIETSSRSELLVTPGSRPKLIFEVTNNYDYPLRIPFSVQDEKSMLTGLYPQSVVIGSKQSAEITVSTTVPPSTSVDFSNQITFTAYATERAQKIAIMYVTSTRMQDNHLPRIDYKFNSNCMEVPYSSCQSTYWTLELTAQDSQSGLMQVLSIPSGIYSPNGYVSGTKEPVHFYYTANCCQPETEIIAIDLSGNRRSFKVDANHANLSAGSIAAIVLGALILLAIIIVIIVLVTKKCKQRDSLDLPRYRGQATSSTRF